MILRPAFHLHGFFTSDGCLAGGHAGSDWPAVIRTKVLKGFNVFAI